MSDIVSRPYRPDPKMACPRCVFRTGVHADWCKLKQPPPPPEKTRK